MARFMRRLQGIGSSILVSLPKEWVIANGLVKGNQVGIQTSSDSLTVEVCGDQLQVREVSISYPPPSDESIMARLTGAYLLGYDIIHIASESPLPAAGREGIRNSTRSLVGMEIVEEYPDLITIQFLPDSARLSPRRILTQMNSISLGMFGEVLNGMKTGDLSGLGQLRSRDVEVNRQYFLLVRLIRGALIDGRLYEAFNMEGTDLLDYRLVANLLENAGDSIVELGYSMQNSDIPVALLHRAYDAACRLERMATTSVNAFVGHDRHGALEAISLHDRYQDGLAGLRVVVNEETPLSYIDMIYGLERIGRFWSDVADLVRPTY